MARPKRRANIKAASERLKADVKARAPARGRTPGNKPRGKRGTAPGPLTPAGLTSTKGAIEARGTLSREQRQIKALEYYDQEMTMAQIGSLLGVSGKTICLDLQAAFADLRELKLEKADDIRRREERLTYRNDRAVLPMLYGQGVPDHVVSRVVGRGTRARVLLSRTPPDPVKVGLLKLRAHERLSASSKARREMFGVDAPIKITPTDPTGTRRYHDLSEEDLARMVGERASLLYRAPLPTASSAMPTASSAGCQSRVLITGGPQTGKTTLADALGDLGWTVRHTDPVALGGDAEAREWSAVSEEVSRWFDAPGPWVIEGVAVPRALRKWAARHSAEPPPCDRLVILSRGGVETRLKGQVVMEKGVQTVLHELAPWLSACEVLRTTDWQRALVACRTDLALPSPVHPANGGPPETV